MWHIIPARTWSTTKYSNWILQGDNAGAYYCNHLYYHGLLSVFFQYNSATLTRFGPGCGTRFIYERHRQERNVFILFDAKSTAVNAFR